MTVLILASSNDLHVGHVAEHLKQLGTEYKIWHLSEFPSGVSFDFSYNDLSGNGHLRLMSGDSIDLQKLTSIWFRRPGGPKSGPMPEPWIERMVEGESRSALGGIFRSLNCLLVNHPGRDNEAMFKLYQLSQASRVNLQVPETIVTNEPNKAREFYEKHNGKVIYKLIGESSNFAFPMYEIPAGIHTLPCRSEDLNHFEQVRLSPHLFQARVDKTADIRATVIGKKVFAARIDSQSGRSKLDWRMDYSVPMEPIELPDEIYRKCLQLMKLMQLNYAAFDFCLQQDGRYVFLELNCAGQYLWLEERANLPISQELALLLSGRAAPIVAASAQSARD